MPEGVGADLISAIVQRSGKPVTKRPQRPVAIDPFDLEVLLWSSLGPRKGQNTADTGY